MVWVIPWVSFNLKICYNLENPKILQILIQTNKRKSENPSYRKYSLQGLISSHKPIHSRKEILIWDFRAKSGAYQSMLRMKHRSLTRSKFGFSAR